jgi:hypothetical protein
LTHTPVMRRCPYIPGINNIIIAKAQILPIRRLLKTSHEQRQKHSIKKQTIFGYNLTQTIASIHKKVTSVRLFTLISDRKNVKPTGGGNRFLTQGLSWISKGINILCFAEFKR